MVLSGMATELRMVGQQSVAEADKQVSDSLRMLECTAIGLPGPDPRQGTPSATVKSESVALLGS